MAYHVIDEAKRCLNCKNPKCRDGCPVGTPINTFIQMLLEGKIKDAGELIFENNPLSVICSLVCYHEKQCEGHCILNRKGSPVHISSIENYISSYYLDYMKENFPKPTKSKIAIIGSGPAGITIAIILANRGYDITIFEGNEKIGGVLTYGIPAFRLPKNILDKYRKILHNMHIKIRPNTIVGSGGLLMDDLFRDGYKAIFVGTGVWKPNSLKIKGESLGHVHFAINYLKNPDAFDLGDSLAIIGAGNVAMDVARTAIRKNINRVTIFSRRGEDDLTASKHEFEYAVIEGVKFQYHKTPVEITDDGVIFADTVDDETEGGGVKIIEGSEKLFEADSVIVAVSQGPRNYIASTTTGLDVSKKGLLITDNTGHTTKPGIFASGDVVTGAKTVVEAVNLSKQVADAIEKYVMSLE